MKASLLNLVDSQVSKFRQMTGLSDSEQCADAFALMFLMPADGVRQLIPDNDRRLKSRLMPML